MCNVIINNSRYNTPKGTLLSDFLIDNGFKVAHICGGRGVCGKCSVTVNGEPVLSCRYVIDTDITVELPSVDIASEIGVGETDKLSQNMCYALDLGTTTLALALVSTDNNEIIRVATCTNPQVSFGADVISRIDYCTKNSVAGLQKSVIEGINSLVGRLGNVRVDTMYVSGNTTMLHLLLGVDPSPMGVAPYTPVFLDSQATDAGALGINCADEIITLPCVSAFVGADLVAGLNICQKPPSGKYNILVDLGTNAEILLFSAEDLYCTSAAAGPCFEGANIFCGMGATSGAIYSFELRNNAPCFKTISDEKAKGICGTGLVDIISELLKNNIIDETGYMDCEVYNITDDISINQQDIRQYQLAKSAVCSAMITLMNMQNITFSDIDKLYISGGFSGGLNVQNAVATGLLPRELKEKTVILNNSSLLGTVKYAIEGGKPSELVNGADYIDLATNHEFSELFINNLDF